eukprot:scaffold7721_cov19-Tisochrysis_lutea.AAC.2
MPVAAEKKVLIARTTGNTCPSQKAMAALKLCCTLECATTNTLIVIVDLFLHPPLHFASRCAFCFVAVPRATGVCTRCGLLLQPCV